MIYLKWCDFEVFTLMNKLKKGLLVLQKLNNSGYKAFIVGGAVRDFLLNRNINDIDIATEANVNDIINIFYLIFFIW